MHKEDKAILSTFVEVFKSFRLDQIEQPQLTYDPTAQLIIANLNEVFFNSVCIKRPLSHDKLIGELQDLQRSLNQPLTVWITPETEDNEFEAELKKHFESPGAFYGMILDINNANFAKTNKNIKIKLVKNDTDATVFSKIYCEIFHFPNLVQHVEQWANLQRKMDNPTCLNYIATIDGSNVGVSTLVIDKNFTEFKTGGFYNACVLPQYRNLGVATAMACHRIETSKTLGLEYLSIILMSNAMARGYCKKLGFNDCKTLTPYFIK